SWLDTAACCRRGSICISAAPRATRWPDTTSICVIWPSTCGCTAVDLRDFSVATYSVVSSIGAGPATVSATGVGGIAGGACADESDRHAAIVIAADTEIAAKRPGRSTGIRLRIGLPRFREGSGGTRL